MGEGTGTFQPSQVKTYVGTKIIQAEPMDRLTFHRTIRKFAGWDASPEFNEGGYKVTYADGYVSWSPKAVFDHAYREITTEEQSLLL